jgi:hypothetical protein
MEDQSRARITLGVAHGVNVWQQREVMDALRATAEGLGLDVDSVEIEDHMGGDLPPGIEAPRG